MATKRRTLKEKRRLHETIVGDLLNKFTTAADHYLTDIDGLETELIRLSYPKKYADLVQHIRQTLGRSDADGVLKTNYNKVVTRLTHEYSLRFWKQHYFDDVSDCMDNMQVSDDWEHFSKALVYAKETAANMKTYHAAVQTFEGINDECSTVGQLNRAAPYLVDFVSEKQRASLLMAERKSRLPALLNNSKFAEQSKQLHTALAIAALLPEYNGTRVSIDVDHHPIVESESG